MKRLFFVIALCLFVASLYAGLFSAVFTDNGCGEVTATWETDMNATSEGSIKKWNGSGWDLVCDYEGGGTPKCGVQEVDKLNHTFIYTGLEVGALYLLSVYSFDESMGQYMDVDDGSSPKEFTPTIPCPVTGGDKINDEMFLILFYK